MTTKLFNPGNNIGKPITRGKFPQQAQSLLLPLDFTDCTIIQASLPTAHGISNVIGLDGGQSFWVNNSDNADSITFTFSSGFQFTCPQYAQGVFPVLVDFQGLQFIAETNGGIVINCFVTNTRELPAIWTSKIPIAGTLNVTGSTIFSSPAPQAYNDKSDTLAVANTAQQLMAVNGNRLSFAIRNPSSAAAQGIAAPESVFLDFGANPSVNGISSWELLPGESLMASEIGIVSTQQINWIAATAGHILVAKEMSS